MKKNKYIWFSFIFLILVISVWSPWITKSYAEQRVIDDFKERQRGIVDGCGFDCPGCGVHKSSKTLFGCEVIILYDCGFKPGPSPIPPYQSKVFVSFLGTVHTVSQGTNLD